MQKRQAGREDGNRTREGVGRLGVIALGLFLLLARSQVSSASDVRIWDNDTSSWTTTFANGDFIDTGTANRAMDPQIAIDSTGVAYVTYYQHDGAQDHIYLSRYDGTDVRIWDNDTSSWTTTFADGDPIDTGTANSAMDPQIAIDSTGVVYITYRQSDGAQDHIYLSRYDGTDVRIWDNDTSSWTTTFANGDPIDTGTANSARKHQIAIDSTGVVYVTYDQHDGANYHVYLSRYDGTDVRIWDSDTSSWTTTIANGDPIDTGAGSAIEAQIAIDSTDVVYVSYSQHDGANYHIYLSRYDGTDVRIWDKDASSWTKTFANGDPIDAGAGLALEAQIAIDSTGVVYVTYYQHDGANQHIYLSRYDGTDVRIWDKDTSSWTTTFADGDPIDPGTANDARSPQLAIDSNGVAYVTYSQIYGARDHIFLSRYDGTAVRIWDNDTSSWTTAFADGDPIDTGNVNNSYGPQIATVSNSVVYVTYWQSDGANQHVYLSRYDGTAVRIWDNDTSSWTTAFADGDPIDTGTANPASNPQFAIDSTGVVYVTYRQSDGANLHIYLSRYGAQAVATGRSGGGGGCFIATAAYGSVMEPHVKILRDFRDRFLLNNAMGKGFTRLYYSYSPPIADFIKKSDKLRAVVRVSLLPMVGVSWFALEFGFVAAVALMFFFFSCFIGLIWLRKLHFE